MARASTKATNQPKVEVVTADEGSEARQVHKVVGRRVSSHTQEFLLEPAKSSPPANEVSPEVLMQCPSCREENPTKAWDDNDDACPGCDWSLSNGSAEPEDNSARLSEVELLFETLGGADDEDEYIIKVDHLPDYYKEGPGKGKENTTAKKEFCRILRGNEVTLDFMETVRRSCVCPTLEPGQQGRFLFTLSKVNGADRGFKKRWPDSITKPLAEEKLPPPSTPTTAAVPVNQTDELMRTLNLAKTIHEIFNSPGKANDLPQQQQLPPLDPFKAAEASLSMLEKAKNLFDRGEPAAPIAAGDQHWSIGLVGGIARLFDSLHVGTLVEKGGTWLIDSIADAQRQAIAEAQRAAAAPGGAANPPSVVQAPPASLPAGPSGPTYPAPAPAPTDSSAPAISAEAMAVLEVVVGELRGYETDEDSDLLEERAARAAAAVRTLPPDTRALLDSIPRAFLLTGLVSLNPEWKDLAHLTDSGKFMDALLSELNDEPEEGSGALIEFPQQENNNHDENQTEDEQQDAPTGAPGEGAGGTA
jgi:hypothetical protein